MKPSVQRGRDGDFGARCAGNFEFDAMHIVDTAPYFGLLRDGQHACALVRDNAGNPRCRDHDFDPNRHGWALNVETDAAGRPSIDRDIAAGGHPSIDVVIGARRGTWRWTAEPGRGRAGFDRPGNPISDEAECRAAGKRRVVVAAGWGQGLPRQRCHGAVPGVSEARSRCCRSAQS